MKIGMKKRFTEIKSKKKMEDKTKKKFKSKKSFSMGLKKLNIGAKYLVALFIVIVLFLGSALITTKFLIDIQKDISILEDRGSRAITITELGSIFREKDIIISDFLNTKDKKLVEDYNEKSKEFSNMLSSIEKYMNTEELKSLFVNIKAEDSAINALFKKEVVPFAEINYKSLIGYARERVANARKDTIISLNKIREYEVNEREVAVSNALANIKKTFYILGLFFALSTVLGLIIVIMINKSVTGNLKKVVNISNQITKGDLTVEKIDYDGEDEIGKLAEAINGMVDSLKSMVMETSHASKSLRDQSGDLDSVAREVLQGSNEISGTMQEMAADVEEQAGTSNNMANVVKEFSELIEESNLKGKKLNESSQIVLTMANEGNSQMEKSVNQMNIINNIIKDSVDKIKGLGINIQSISKLINVINDISQQTNLLALNASIEAARAGEYGRGFAVVAEEIRKLAEQVGNSVTEITGIVKDIQKESSVTTEALEIGYQEVGQGTNQVKVAGESFAKINNEVNSVGNMIVELTGNLEKAANNSEKISQSVEEAASISEKNAGGIEEISALVEQQNASMESVKKNAELMEELVGKLTNLIKKYNI